MLKTITLLSALFLISQSVHATDLASVSTITCHFSDSVHTVSLTPEVSDNTTFNLSRCVGRACMRGVFFFGRAVDIQRDQHNKISKITISEQFPLTAGTYVIDVKNKSASITGNGMPSWFSPSGKPIQISIKNCYENYPLSGFTPIPLEEQLPDGMTLDR